MKYFLADETLEYIAHSEVKKQIAVWEEVFGGREERPRCCPSPGGTARGHGTPREGRLGSAETGLQVHSFPLGDAAERFNPSPPSPAHPEGRHPP